MADDWCKFLALARRLSAEDDDASQRSAISRAYYSAFHVLLDYVVAHDPNFPRSGERGGEQVHKRLWDWFAERHRVTRSKLAWRVANDGRAARDKRNSADYDDIFTGLKSEAQAAITRAEGLIKLTGDANLKAASSRD